MHGTIASRVEEAIGGVVAAVANDGPHGIQLQELEANHTGGTQDDEGDLRHTEGRKGNKRAVNAMIKELVVAKNWHF